MTTFVLLAVYILLLWLSAAWHRSTAVQSAFSYLVNAGGEKVQLSYGRRVATPPFLSTVGTGLICMIYRMVEQCHFTYITKFKPTQEQVCEENFEKKCQITFKQQGFNETVKKCYKPVQKVNIIGLK